MLIFFNWNKTLRETVSDLEVANARCVQLSNDLKAETTEVDKLRIFKFMVRQADIREESLRAKVIIIRTFTTRIYH